VKATNPPPHRSLALPRVRSELLLYLQELEADDPRRKWQEERQQGLVSGIDQVFHFFFDDHPFDEADIGVVFFNQDELTAVEAVKRALDAVLKAIGDAGDDEFVEHPLWQDVTRAATIARSQLSARS